MRAAMTAADLRIVLSFAALACCPAAKRSAYLMPWDKLPLPSSSAIKRSWGPSRAPAVVMDLSVIGIQLISDVKDVLADGVGAFDADC